MTPSPGEMELTALRIYYASVAREGEPPQQKPLLVGRRMGLLCRHFDDLTYVEDNFEGPGSSIWLLLSKPMGSHFGLGPPPMLVGIFVAWVTFPI